MSKIRSLLISKMPSLKKKFFLLSYILPLICITIYSFPYLFPDFVVYAITNNTLEVTPSDNLPNTEETATIDTSHFPNPIQKEGILLTGDVAYWAVFRFRIVFSACTLYWFNTSTFKCW